MISNITHRNVSLILALSSLAGVLYCVYSTIYKGTEWILICPIIMSTAIFTKFYISYRKEIKKGNIYGRVKRFR